jgi:hypothetical protein
MRLDGKSIVLQTGDIIRFDRGSSSLMISRGNRQMCFDDGSTKFFLGGGDEESMESDFRHIADLLAQTHNFKLSDVVHHGASRDPHFIFKAA